MKIKKMFEDIFNKQKKYLKMKEVPLEQVLADAGVEFCPECGTSLKVENVQDPDGKTFAEVSYCEGCGYTEST